MPRRKAHLQERNLLLKSLELTKQVTTQNLQCVRTYSIKLKQEVKEVNQDSGLLEKAQMLAKQYKAKGGGYK